MEESQLRLYKKNNNLINRALNDFLYETLNSLLIDLDNRDEYIENHYYLFDNNYYSVENENIFKFIQSEIRSEFDDLFLTEIIEISDNLNILRDNLNDCDDLISFTKELLLNLPPENYLKRAV